MKQRVLGSTGVNVSPMGLAALSVASGGHSISAEEVERAFHELGVRTFFVHPFMKSLAEGVRRLIAAGHRHEMVIVSEASIPIGWSVHRSLEKHLRVFGTDYMDVWMMGWVRRRWDIRDAVWNELQDARSKGLTRAIGFSSHDRALALELTRELGVDVLMIRYNAAHRGAEHEIFEPLAAQGPARPGIIAYTATRWGMLLKPLPERGFDTAMTGPECYRFVLQHPMVDCVWTAPRTWQELVENVQGIELGPLPPNRLEEVRSFGDAVHDAAQGGRKWMFGSTAG